MAVRVAIMYGFAEGPRHGARLAQAMEKRGFTTVDDATTADIVIAHSGATHTLPASLTAKLVILAAPSCSATGMSIIWTSVQKALKDVQLVMSAQSRKSPAHLAWNAWYLVRHPLHNRTLQRETFRAKESLPNMKATNMAVIAYKGDPWRQHTPVDTPYCYVSLPGSHDSLWYQCEDFANTVQLLYERLLA